MQQLLAGIPQSGARLGNPQAPVTLIYYGDLECSACRGFAVDAGLSELIANDVHGGRVQVVYRGFETATRDPHTFQAQQVAALDAGQQNHFWDFVELFYRQQGAEGTGYVTNGYLATEGVAAGAGRDPDLRPAPTGIAVGRLTARSQRRQRGRMGCPRNPGRSTSASRGGSRFRPGR